jgi:hypothetical protein
VAVEKEKDEGEKKTGGLCFRPKLNLQTHTFVQFDALLPRSNADNFTFSNPSHHEKTHETAQQSHCHSSPHGFSRG